MVVSDRPGGIAELTRLISNVGVSIKDIVHERAWVRTNAFAAGVRENHLMNIFVGFVF